MTNINQLTTSPSVPADTENTAPFRQDRYSAASDPFGLTVKGHKKHQAMKSFRCMLGVVALGFLWVGATATAQTFTTLKSFGGSTNVSGTQPDAEVVQGPDGTLYGTTALGGGNAQGIVFKIQPDGSGFTVLKGFANSADGARPYARLTLSGNTLYGTTVGGAVSDYGTVFKVNTDGTDFTVLKHFSGGDGARPYGGLALSGSVLYGTTRYGGSSDFGTVFKLNTDGTDFVVLKHFDGSDGKEPIGGLTLSGSTLYGTASFGGSFSSRDGLGYGTVFKLDTDGTGFTVLKHFNFSGGAIPLAGLTLSGNVLYGTTAGGGSSITNIGTVFRLNTDGTDFTVLKDFTGSGERFPRADVTLSGNVLYGTTRRGGNADFGTAFQLNTDGTGYSVLKHFAGSDGAYPEAGLTFSGSTLYGTTQVGGNYGSGTLFRMNTDGTGHIVLKHFGAGADGRQPYAGLTLSGSTLYGTTLAGGASGRGTVFQMNADGTGYTELKHFTGADGDGPSGDLTLSGSALYGTTWRGGSANLGTAFKLDTDGTGFVVLKHFTGSDGKYPRSGLALSEGTLYGTTSEGGSTILGTLFRVNTDGTGFMVLKDFTYMTYTDGANPTARLTLSGNVLYGTTQFGGSLDQGTVFRMSTNGTDFTVLQHFDYWSNGANPYAGLTLSGNVLYGTTAFVGTVFKVNTDGTGFKMLKELTGSDGVNPYGLLTLSGTTLYGTTQSGGSSNLGTVFQLNTDGTGFQVLKDFTGSDGSYPFAGLTMSGSVLYGTTHSGGSSGLGTVFKIKLSLPLVIQSSGNAVVLSWTDPALALQAAPFAGGSYTNIPGATSPYTNAMDAPQQFFRLIGN
jgi:uncharacterized repeat protein (TIGR03803 family)